MTDPRSRIPSVDSLVGSEAFARLLGRYARERVVDATRKVVDDVRADISAGGAHTAVAEPTAFARDVEARLTAGDVPSLRPVINATGVVLHTNLGRAPLAAAAVDAMKAAAEYSNVEYDLGSGARGSRYVHCVSLLIEITGAEDALVVNNAAAGLTLAMNTLALGRGVAVSRGELVEIGGGFRIPEVLERAGSLLVEVGSTNRTRVDDYRAVLSNGGVAALLKVHRSNFRISGFTEEASVADLVGLATENGLPLVHDLGSGLIVDAATLSLPAEPRAVDSVAAGSDIVVVSGDKLLGGPQAGVVVGRADAIAEMRQNPLCRALRVDKVTLAGLEATLRLYREPERALTEIPALRMLAISAEELRPRAEALAARLHAAGVACVVREAHGAVGGGTYPGAELASWAVALEVEASPDRVVAALRDGDPPIIGRIVDDVVHLDVRTLLPGQVNALVRRAAEALRGLAPRG